GVADPLDTQVDLRRADAEGDYHGAGSNRGTRAEAPQLGADQRGDQAEPGRSDGGRQRRVTAALRRHAADAQRGRRPRAADQRRARRPRAPPPDQPHGGPQPRPRPAPPPPHQSGDERALAEALLAEWTGYRSLFENDHSWVGDALRPVIEAAFVTPELHGLFPLTSMNRLCFSQ